jgi:predicted flap endonuclease-1-like 5' DNA nuclease
MPVVTSREDWPVVRQSGGPDLVRVQIGPHSYVKQRPQKEDKMRRPQDDKRKKPKEDKGEETAQPADDFTELPGVGEATAETLQEHGLHTFDELMQADLSFLSARAREAVEAWRNG